MYNMPDNTNTTISMRLSEVLDDIGVNERMLMKRRRVKMLEETTGTITNRLIGDNETMYLLGSQSEGTTTIGLHSDFDLLFCLYDFNVIQDWSEWKLGMKNLLMVQDETTSPGYCFLQWLRSDEPLPMTDILYKHCIRDRRGRILWKNTWLNDIQGGGVQHGPSHAIPGRQGYCDKDIVAALPCTSWPQSATGWLERQGIGRWPTPEMKRYAVSNGFFVVSVGSKVSASRDLEWRISTSLAERCLMFNLNVLQIRCYILMKMILKTFLNPHGDNNLSSFMCKTVLLHCVENTESNIWQEHNLFICLTYCLLELHNCVQSDHCPHFIIHENNLMAGQFSVTVKHQLLERISDFIQSDRRALLRIPIDNLGQRLQIKLNMVPQLAYNLNSPAEISENCSGLLYLNFSKQISKAQEQILKVTDNNTEIMKQQVTKIINFINQGNRLEQAACRYLAPFLYTILGSSLASSSIGQTNTVSPEALVWLSAGLNSDISSSKLKLASVFYCTGDMERAEFILQQIERQYNPRVVMAICDCWDIPRPERSAELDRICNELNEDCIQHITAFCIRFLRCEINCVPRELQLEMFRSTRDDMLSRDQRRDYWMDWAVVDSLPYLYFLQYKTYGHLQRYQDQQLALSNLALTIATVTGLGHKETALNLLGQCMEQQNRPQDALQCYLLSLQQRATNNAARVHICRLLSNAVENQ